MGSHSGHPADPDRGILCFLDDVARFVRVFHPRNLYAHDALIQHERNMMDERFVDAHDRGDFRRREPRGEIGYGFKVERAVLHVDHAVVETGGFDDPWHAARGKLLETGAERGPSLAHGPAYAVLFHLSPRLSGPFTGRLWATTRYAEGGPKTGRLYSPNLSWPSVQRSDRTMPSARLAASTPTG